MSILVTKVTFSDGYYLFHLNDGRVIGEELSKYKRLADATQEQLNHYRLIAGGVGVNWPDLDEDLSVAGLLEIKKEHERMKRINVTIPERLLEQLDRAIVGKYNSRSQFFQKKAEEIVS